MIVKETKKNKKNKSGKNRGNNSTQSGHKQTMGNTHELTPQDIIYHKTDQIQQVIDFLLKNFIYSEQPSHRKGGLLGLSAVIMALTTKRNALTYEGIFIAFLFFFHLSVCMFMIHIL